MHLTKFSVVVLSFVGKNAIVLEHLTVIFSKGSYNFYTQYIGNYSQAQPKEYAWFPDSKGRKALSTRPTPSQPLNLSYRRTMRVFMIMPGNMNWTNWKTRLPSLLSHVFFLARLVNLTLHSWLQSPCNPIESFAIPIPCLKRGFQRSVFAFGGSAQENISHDRRILILSDALGPSKE